MEQHYHNAAVLPRSLEILLLILHGVRIGSGVLVFFFGIGTTVYYNQLSAIFPLMMGLAGASSGTMGLLATVFKSLAAHGGCVATSAVMLYMGYMNYNIFLGISFSINAQNNNIALFVCNVVLTVLDIMLSAASLGFQAIVLYISTKRP